MTFQSLINFTPNDWYWLAQDGRIYSSARGMLVYAYDTPYLAFLAKYGNVTPWPVDADGQQTTAALAAVLAGYGISIAI